MLTGELRNRVDSIWTTLWTEGSTQPLVNIEQITYLLFMKGLDEAELAKEEDANLFGLSYESIFPKDKPEYRWHVFKNIGDATYMFNLMQTEIFPFIKNLKADEEDAAFSKYMKDATFNINKAQTLQKVVTAIDDLPTEDNDIKGDIYEYLLSKLATSGTNGQFRTPRHIIKMMVALTKPEAGDVIADPACGTSGFLVAASEYLRENDPDLFFDPQKANHFHNEMFHGFDMDTTMLRISAMNMMLHSVENPDIAYRDSLSDDNPERDKYSLILANPPFKGSLDYESVSADIIASIKTKKTELLFVDLFLKMLKPGGRAAVIVPDGVLFGASKAHKTLRQNLIENHELKGVISMPSGVFKPYTGVSTGILIFNKTGIGGTDKVWFYDMENDGYSLNDNRNPIEENDIPDIIDSFANLEDQIDKPRTGKSFMVDKEEIAQNDYDLSINKYKEIEYEKIAYDKPEDIIARIVDLEKSLSENIQKLKSLSNDIFYYNNDNQNINLVKLKDYVEINPPKSEVRELNPNTVVSFVPMEDVSENGELSLSKTKTIEEAYKGFTYFKDDDVVVAKITPCFENGKGALMKNLVNGIGFGTTEFHVLRSKDKNIINPVWLNYLTRTRYFRELGKMRMSGSAGQKRIGRDFLENFKFSIPEIELQNKFESIINNIDNQKKTLISLIGELDYLSDSLMQDAFGGSMTM